MCLPRRDVDSEEPALRTATRHMLAPLAGLALLSTGSVGCNESETVIRSFPDASLVVFQANFEDNDYDTTASSLYEPYGNVTVVGNRLYVPDYSNDRVMGFTSLPTSNGQAADFVLGQATFDTDGDSDAANGITDPSGSATDGTNLYLADYGNHRVLIWNPAPTTTQEAADIVLGQAGFDLSDEDCSAGGMNHPEAVAVGGDKLVVADAGNNRVLIWNTIPTSSSTPPNLVLGQADFVHCTENDDDQDESADAGPTARTMSYPAGVWTDGTRLAVLENDNRRVLIWTTFPTSSFQPADLVIGQSNFTNFEENDDDQDGTEDDAPTARVLGSSNYGGPDFDGRYFCVPDTSNNRVLIWDGFPSSNFEPADVVIGQATFTMDAENDDDQDGEVDDTASARTLSAPTGCAFYDDRLWVTDYGNNRITVYDLPL